MDEQKNKNRKFRMYGLVPFSLSPIQQGIQFGHAVVEYGIEHFHSEEYLRWAKNDKTFIILNGGTTNRRTDLETKEYVGSLNRHAMVLHDCRVPFSTFYEPDLGDQLTAVVFLADDRVWDKETYPDFDWDKQYMDPLRGMDDLECQTKMHAEWLDTIGGTQNAFLRTFLSQFKLA